MIPASDRGAFIETLQELTDLVEAPLDDLVEWTAEYLSRNRTWYHFDGLQQNGSTVASRTAFDTGDGSMSSLDPAILPLALLDFNDNAAVAAYHGARDLSTGIAAGFLRGFAHVPEIVRVSIERTRKAECGSVFRTSTAFVFVGFEHDDDVDDVGTAKGLAASPDAVSQHWYRGRTRIVRAALGEFEGKIASASGRRF